MARLYLGALIVVASTAIFWTSPASAAADLGVTAIDCDLHPGQLDLVYVKNQGDAPQDLAGWMIKSDAPGEELSLAPIDSIDAGEEIYFTAGVHAVNLPGENTFLWSNKEVLRDGGEPPDYAVLIDPSGNQASGMDCLGRPLSPSQPPPTAAPQPTQAPAAAGDPQSTAPTPAPAGQPRRPATGTSGGAVTSPESVPPGGGPPAAAREWSFLILAAGLAGVACSAALLGAALRRSSGQARRTR